MVNTYRSLTFVQFFVVSPLCRRSIEILKVSRGWIGSTSKKMAALSNPCAQASLCLWRHCVRGHARTQPLICVACSVHYLHYWLSCAINKGFFSRLPFVVVVDTRLPRFEALAYVLPHFYALTRPCLRFASLLRANSRPRRSSFKRFGLLLYSVFVNRSSFKNVLNLRKAYISLHPE